MPRKLPELTVTYHYREPKTPQEKAEAERNVSEAYAILFEEVLKQRKNKSMKIYLDIDGVLVGRGRQPGNHVAEFLKVATERHDCYWATTHCKGDSVPAMDYLKEILPAEAFEYCKLIKATEWSHKKTEIFEYKSDFLWFEDAPFDFEKEVLAQHGKSNSLILVDLISNPDHLKELIKLL